MENKGLHKNKQNRLEYPGGQEDWESVHEIATACSFFLMDDEDECVSDLDPSCYNCKYRRWTAKSFTCMK